MGVPAFFRWLTLRYPKIVIEAREDLDIGFNLNKIIEDNFGENRMMPIIDNLYLDMNGIIHPCAHPEDRDAPSSLAEMFNSIFDYCDKVISIIKPKKLIYMAIDGVAPRAKMNQQRSRRFRAAIDAEQKERISKKIEEEWRDKGLPTEFLDTKKEKFKFDSNFITPGTEFLDECSKALKQYIKSRINKDPLWKNVNIILSDASVPGEGEHKILDFIRTQRNSDKYDVNTCHCIYGADADLIMLSLIMHEPHFYVLRESLNENYYLICDICKKHGHSSEKCKNKEGKFNTNGKTQQQIAEYNRKQINEIEFSLLKVEILREYLKIEFKDLIKSEYDFERIIDDFVFLCFLVGNDFLPNLPSLKIREGAIDALIYLYKKLLPEMKEYLTNGEGKLNLTQCEILFKKLSLVEDEFFRKEMRDKAYNEKNKKKSDSKSKKTKNNDTSLNDFRKIKNNNIKNIEIYNQDKYNEIIKEEIIEENSKIVEYYVDNIKLGRKGWKDRYYLEKFHISSKSDKNTLKDLKEIIKKYYIEGLFWVFEYYYNGCVSWSWFYPFHYAPFASDLINLKDLKINFELSEPFLPFEQLLSVLPPYSADALPLCFRKLMRNPLSPIADFYPKNIKLDINNQPYAWMGVNLLPFVDEKRIHKIVEIFLNKYENELDKKDIKLNRRGDNILFSQDLQIIKNFSGELISCDKSLKEENTTIKDLFLDNPKQDKSKCYILRKDKKKIKHRSIIFEGVRGNEKCIIEDNLDYYSKDKFKGIQAIEIVRNILGYTDDDDVEQYFMQETFGEKYGNNNRGVEYEPKKMFILRKKRFREKFSRIKKGKISTNKNNNFSNQNYDSHIYKRRKLSDNNSQYRKRKNISKRYNKNSEYRKKDYNNISLYKDRSYSKRNKDNLQYSRSRYKSRSNYNRDNKDNFDYYENDFKDDNEKYRKMQNEKTEKKNYYMRFRK